MKNLVSSLKKTLNHSGFYILLSICFFAYSSVSFSEGELSERVVVETEEEIEDNNSDKTNLIGEVDLDLDLNEKKKNTYNLDQEYVINYFKEIVSATEHFSSNSNEKLNTTFIELTDSQLLYYASAYLYCITKKGTCPFLLNALLESDLMLLCNFENKKCQRPKKVACRNMTRMWKIWIDNDLEQRLNHNIPIGLMGKNNDFKQNEFPKYLKCSQTLLPEVKAALKNKNYIKKRYKSVDIKEDIEKTISFLKAIKKNIGNIIVAQGIS